MDDGPSRPDGGSAPKPAPPTFWTRQDPPYPMLRDVAVGAIVVLVVLSGLWSYTGRWGHSPVVVVESGSMMHCAQPPGAASYGRDCKDDNLGRLGTIDPGDLILVKAVHGHTDVATLAGGGGHHYGRSGDVVVYRPDGASVRTPVIHRALFWIQVETDGTFSVPELGLSHVSDLDDPAIQAFGLPAGYANVIREPSLEPVCGPVGPGRSGFITRGDNNPGTDQSGLHAGAIEVCPVQPAWVVGKARGEVPWLGLVKLLVSDLSSHLVSTRPTSNYHNAAGDCKVFLWLTLGVLIGGPYMYERVKGRRKEGTPPAS